MFKDKKAFAVLLAGTFFVSGFSALLYQVVWQRMLGLFAGSDVRSVTIVTGAFLAGLGVGGLIGAFLADRLDSYRAVQAFGLCNLGIAVFAIFSRFLFYDLLSKQLIALAGLPIAMSLVVFVSLLWPTILMGLSLPLLSKALVRNIGRAAQQISLLYGINTVGASVGSFITGWYLAGTIGFDRSLYVGSLLSGLVGITALWIARQFRPSDRSEAPVAAPIQLDLRCVPRSVWNWCGLVFVSGFMAISLELIWFRVLDVSLKSNAYTFAYLLCLLLVGDGAGSLIGARVLSRIQNPRRVFLLVQIVIALYAVVAIWLISLVAIRYTPFTTYILQATGLSFNSEAPLTDWLIYLVAPTFILMPPALLMGFYFPVVQKAVQTDYQVVAQRVSLVKVANIAGNTTGSILTGAVLLNFLGTSGSLRIIVLIGLFFALVLLRENFAVFKKRSRIVAGVLAAALLVTLVTFPAGRDLWSRLHGARADQLFIFAEDSSGVSAFLQPDAAAPASLFINGLRQGIIPFIPVHGMLGAFPALIHPNPERIMVIGVGTGGTSYAVGVNPRTRHILNVELIGSELTALTQYADQEQGRVLQRLLNDPRYEIIVGDGRQALALNQEKFDIIEVDAIRPISSHSGLLYSREFFEAAYARLAEGGIMAQWRPTNRVEATFVSVFPYVVNIGNFLLLGSDSPIPYDPQLLLKRLQDPQVVGYLKAGTFDVSQMRPPVESPAVIWTSTTPRASSDINTDLLPKDEYYLNNGP